jgi:hypothetical protein
VLQSRVLNDSLLRATQGKELARSGGSVHTTLWSERVQLQLEASLRIYKREPRSFGGTALRSDATCHFCSGLIRWLVEEAKSNYKVLVMTPLLQFAWY